MSYPPCATAESRRLGHVCAQCHARTERRVLSILTAAHAREHITNARSGPDVCVCVCCVCDRSDPAVVFATV